MKSLSKLLLVIFIGFIISLTSYGQSVIDNFTFDIEAVPNDLGMPGLDTLYTLKCIIQTNDSDSISNIYVKVGTSENADDIFSHTFLNSTSQQLPDGTSFLKQGNKFYILLGDYFEYQFFYEVKLEDLLGNVSEPVLLTL